MLDAQELWDGCSVAIQSQVSDAVWRTWFAGVHPVGLVNGTFVLSVPNVLVRERLETRFAGVVRAAVIDLSGSEFPIRFDVAPDSAPAPFEPGVAEIVTDQPVASNGAVALLEEPLPAGHNQTGRYTFEGFVIGPSNRFAHAAALSVAESPGSAYNPLFIIGGAGLGKTHLLQAIRNYVTENFPRYEVRYVPTETLLNEFIESLRAVAMPAFKRRYRECDVLLVDDIQAIEGKEQLQEEFFHTFNALHDAGKQLVLTSDRAPGSIKTLESRLRSRFMSGLITEINPPELETRIAILRTKAHHENLVVDDDVLEFLASIVTDNIRELEGALIRVTAYASLTQERLTRDTAELVLADLVADRQPRRITGQQILEATADHFGFTIEELCSASRRRPLVIARQIGMYLFRTLTDFSYPAIAREFGGRDHTTVIHAYDKISGLMKERRQIYEQVTELTVRIRNGRGPGG
ncbi:MAG: chromosomal replication initiator protein DnaA [Acidimicrobiales bacterium]